MHKLRGSGEVAPPSYIGKVSLLDPICTCLQISYDFFKEWLAHLEIGLMAGHPEPPI